MLRRSDRTDLPSGPSQEGGSAHVGAGARTSLDVFTDALGVVLDVRGDLRPRLSVQLHRLVTDQLATWSVSLRQQVVRSLEAGDSSDGTYWLRDDAGAVMQVVCTLDTGDGNRWHLHLDEVVSRPALPEDREAFAAQERVGLIDLLMDLDSSGVGLAESVTGSLRWIMQAFQMDAAAYFLVRDKSNAGLVAAYGKTRKRGFPYPELDLLQPSLRPLLGSRLLDLTNDLGDAGIRAAACPGARRMLLTPATAAGAVNGVLLLSRRAVAPVSSQERRNLLTAGRLLGAETRASVLAARSAQSGAVLQSAYAVSRAISLSLDLDKTFRQIAVNATRLIPGSRCLLLELDTDTRDLFVVASSETGDELVGARIRFQDMDALRQGYVELRIDELISSTQISPAFRAKISMDTAVFLPMLAQNELIGSLLLFSPASSEDYDLGDLAVAEEVAEQAAIAVYNARLYQDLVESRGKTAGLLTRITRVRDQERREVATLLHDDILQSVIGAIYELEAFRDGLEPVVSARLDRPLGVLRAAVDDAREAISDLRPPQLDELGFAASMRAMVARADDEGPVRVELQLEPMLGLEHEKASALYRIAREALVNAKRHAQARAVWVSVRKEDREGAPWISLSVSDDGVGMSASESARGEHFGLSLMEEQAALVGGAVEFRPRIGGGTVVAADVPARS